MTDPYWFPLYEALVELDVPAMIHVSASCNPNFHALGAHYLNADTTVFMQLIEGDLFERVPDAPIRHPARRRRGALPLGPLPRPGRPARAAAAGRAPDEQRLLRHLRLPPGRHRPAARVIDADNILFASEMIGAVRGVDPETGFHWDDTKRYVDAADVSDADRHKLFESNVRRVYPRLDPILKAGGWL